MQMIKWIMAAACALLISSAAIADTSRTGEAVVAALTGPVQARYFIGPAHDGRTETRDLFQGAAVGERSQVMTGQAGHTCLVLTPGVLLHVGPESQLTIDEMRLTAPGLPRSEDDLVRRVTVRLDSGRIFVVAGIPTPSLQLRVITDSGTIEASGGTFSVVDIDDGFSVLVEEFEIDLVPTEGERLTVSAGGMGRLSASDTQQVEDGDEAPHRFLLCRGLFNDLEPFFHIIRGFDRGDVARFIGLGGPPIFLGAQGLIADVSPSFRPTRAATAAPDVPALSGPAADRRWPQERIWRWWDEVGVIRGVNYIPRTVVNSTEMWMEETFDIDTMDEELAGARVMGYTAVRVILQQAVWEADRDGFLDRVDEFLELAHYHGLTVVPVLFDDLNRAGKDPFVGPQDDPAEGVHNPVWTPSPGRSSVTDMRRWPVLEEYVSDVVGRFKRDNRILYWDVYNTAGNDGLWEETLPLMDTTVDWVRDINPRQPVAVPAWRDLGSPMSARKLERSDLITFHTFENAAIVEAQVKLLQRFGRPMVASDWLLRQTGNTFEEILPIFAQYGVGWFNRGLVQGRTQMWIQDEVHRLAEEPDIWQHDMLTSDGEPFDEREIELIRGFRYEGGRQ